MQYSRYRINCISFQKHPSFELYFCSHHWHPLFLLYIEAMLAYITFDDMDLEKGNDTFRMIIKLTITCLRWQVGKKVLSGFCEDIPTCSTRNSSLQFHWIIQLVISLAADNLLCRVYSRSYPAHTARFCAKVYMNYAKS